MPSKTSTICRQILLRSNMSEITLLNTCQAQQDVDYIQANTIVLPFVFSSYIKSSGETDTVVVPMNISYPYPYTSTYTWESTCVTLILTLLSPAAKNEKVLSLLFSFMKDFDSHGSEHIIIISKGLLHDDTHATSTSTYEYYQENSVPHGGRVV